MDITFFLTTIVFIIFLIISYFLKIIKKSTPLVLIYFVFCFSHIIDRDISEEKTNLSDEVLNDDNKKTVFKNKDENLGASKKIDKSLTSSFSVPVVALNPKPIVIDSNLIIQKDKEKIIIVEEKDYNGDKLNEPKKVDDLSNTLSLNEIMICRGVYKRNPIKPGFKFTNNVDSLFCYTKISNNGSKQEIKHLWYYNDNLITSVVYNIKTSYNYRSWSKKTILPKQTGLWRVDIVDSKEKILGSRKFQILSLNDVF